MDMAVLPPTNEQTVGAIAACGVPAGNVRITWEDELQSDVVWISDLGGADEARLRCVRQAVYPVYLVEIEAADQRGAYLAFAGREDRIRARAAAVTWLEERRLLGRLPRYDPRQGLEAFVRELETACSIPAGTALEIVGPSVLTVRWSYLDNLIRTNAHDQLTCLLEMVTASNADEHRIFLGFTGNEAMSDDR